MGHKVFIPVTDEILYEYPELITSPLRPYQVDNPCYHWMAAIEPADTKFDDDVKADDVRAFSRTDRKMAADKLPVHNPGIQTDSRLA